jgi:biotin-[acetyl-CoA-carboxylase] ligase BirA-like protein
LIILTDTREWSDRLLVDLISDPANIDPAGFPFVESWRDLTASQLLPAEQRLWEALDGGSKLSLCEIAARPDLAKWDYLVIIDDASGSQFDALRKVDPAQLPGSVACVAATGHGFHGHRDRTWTTRRGNLHLSTLCNPDLDAATCGLAMTTLPAVAVLDALRAQGPWTSKPGIKWVNDILIGDSKVAGVLTATQSVRGRLTALTLGIGVNVESTPVVPATPFVPAAASLAGCLENQSAGAAEPRLGTVLSHCLQAIAQRLESVSQSGPSPLVQTYRDNSLVVGRRVVIWPDNSAARTTAEEPVEPLAIGVVQNIGPDLSLTLSGHPDPILCGRLAFQRD